jgi:protein-L-isoaspartate(D-aspartate) O-methyltransferase
MEKQAWEELIQRLIRAGILRSPKVIRALRQVPRDSFLPERVKAHAAVDSPLPIGFGQTISAPLS